MADFDLFKFAVDDALPPVPNVSALTGSSNPQIGSVGSSTQPPIVPLTTFPANPQPPILPLMTFPIAGNSQPGLLGASGSANPPLGGIYTPSLLGVSANPPLDTRKPPRTPQFIPSTPPLETPATPQQPSNPKILPQAPSAPLKLATPSTPSASAAPSKPPLSSNPAKSGTPSTPAKPQQPPASSTPGASAAPATPVVPAQPTIFDELFDLDVDEVGMMGPYQWTRQTAVAPTFAAGSGNNQLNLSTHRRIHYELLMMKLQHLS
jgi:hypothetical protein